MTNKYAVVLKRGWFGNKTTILSTHSTYAAASAAAKGKYNVVLACGKRKGDVVYCDAYPEVVRR